MRVLGGLTGGFLEQNPVAWLRSSRPRHAELVFNGEQLDEIHIGGQKFKLLRKEVSVFRSNPEECQRENWSEKTSSQILD